VCRATREAYPTESTEVYRSQDLCYRTCMTNHNQTTHGQYLISVRASRSVLPWRKFRWSLTLRTYVLDAEGQGYPEYEREYELYSGRGASRRRAWRKAELRLLRVQDTNQFFTEFETIKENTK
jgi:hypothetical protein